MRFFDASTATDLEPVAAVLADVKRLADQLEIEIMVVGAVARDILIRHYIGLDPERATADIDIAVAVSTWAEVDKLTNVLDGPPKIPHRFFVRGIEVDMIPFGRIESPDRTIMWSNDHKMNVFGFAEALRAAVRVKLPGEIVVSVASLPAQSLLKLFAWRDRRRLHKRDAIDLKTILIAYHQGPYHDSLYNDHIDLLERHDFDPWMAGAARIGREASTLIAPADRGIVSDILQSSEDLVGALATDMGGGRIADNYPLIEAYRQGFMT